MGDVYEYGVLS